MCGPYASPSKKFDSFLKDVDIIFLSLRTLRPNIRPVLDLLDIPMPVILCFDIGEGIRDEAGEGDWISPLLDIGPEGEGEGEALRNRAKNDEDAEPKAEWGEYENT
jgi:hypothetical protein